MKLLTRFLFQQFSIFSSLSLVFFLIILFLADIFKNLSDLSPFEIPFSQMIYLSLLSVPQGLSYALAPSLLFGVSFVLGNMYANNELIIVLGSGISLRRFTSPLFLIGALLSVFLFFWNDQGVIPSQKVKNNLERHIQGHFDLDNTNIALLVDQGRVFYKAKYYNHFIKKLSEVTLSFQTDKGLDKIIKAEWADWKESFWVFSKVSLFTWSKDGQVSFQSINEWSDPTINEAPENFQKRIEKISELSFEEAGLYVENLKRTGLPYLEQETEYLQRLSFSLSPFIVVWISAAIGGRFKKNILLMSMLTSLLISSGYIILQMIFGILAKTGFIPPLIGSMMGAIVGLIAGIILFTKSHT